MAGTQIEYDAIYGVFAGTNVKNDVIYDVFAGTNFENAGTYQHSVGNLKMENFKFFAGKSNYVYFCSLFTEIKCQDNVLKNETVTLCVALLIIIKLEKKVKSHKKTENYEICSV